MHGIFDRNRSRRAKQEDKRVADGPTYTDALDDTARGPAPGSAPATPRWVKVCGFLALIAVVALIVMFVADGGQHGPGRHAPDGGQQQPAGQVPSGGAGAHTPPAGGH